MDDLNRIPEVDNTISQGDTWVSLPEVGSMVRATTLPSIEYNRKAQEIEGILYTVPSPFGGTPNTYVNGIGVDPTSVIAVDQSTNAPQ